MSEGILYIVATPIGNLSDITYRAVKILNEVDLIAAEDTRQTLKLLSHYDIKKPMVSYYEYNKLFRGESIIEQLKSGLNVALVSDAGTPGISDPGEDLIKLAIENNIVVTMLPGAVAGIMGLVLSGLSTRRFVFEGFLPKQNGDRKKRLEIFANEPRTIVFYEAPHRIVKTLAELDECLGSRKIAVARELTKKFEEIIRGTSLEILQHFNKTVPKGEFVIIIEGQSQEEKDAEQQKLWDDISVFEQVSGFISEGMDKKTAFKKAAELRGIRKNQIYIQYEKEKGERTF